MICDTGGETQYYQAPEVLLDAREMSFSSDIWSMCFVSLEWISGVKSWQMSGKRNHIKMKTDHKEPCQLSRVSNNIREILTPGLSYIYNERPCAEEMRQKIHEPCSSGEYNYTYGSHKETIK